MGPSRSNSSRPSLPRKKACEQCSIAKVRCDHRRGQCTRCGRRSLRCTYIGPVAQEQKELTANSDNAGSVASNDIGRENQGLLPPSNRNASVDLGSHIELLQAQGTFPMAKQSLLSSPSHASTTSADVGLGSQGWTVISGALRIQCDIQNQLDDALDFSNGDLVCTVSVNEIQNRWLNAYIPASEQIFKNYSPGTTLFVSRVLKAYSSGLVRKATMPPFIHPLQLTMSVMPYPLANCLSLVRLCDVGIPSSERFARETIEKEMNELYENRQSLNGMTLLAAFQAYLIYAMIMFFLLNQSNDRSLRQSMVYLQDLACEVSREGLVSSAEIERARPKWESWIMAEAKRRTLYTMYLFDNVLCANDGLPILLGTELQGIPAPASKMLWQAASRESWHVQYNNHLCEWADGFLSIDELWPIPAEFSDADIAVRRRRVDRWLESVDGYGTLMSAVTMCTHGG